MFVAFGENSVGFLYVYAGILGSMYFEIPTFDFQHPSTQPTAKRVDDKFLCKTRCGCKPHLPGLGIAVDRTYRAWGLPPKRRGYNPRQR